MSTFADQVVFITGAARGQGRAYALAFAREGATLVICDLAKDTKTAQYDLGTSRELEETVRQCESLGAAVIFDYVDVRNYDQVEALVNRATERFGRIDVVVANAGIFALGLTVDMTPETFANVIDVNLKGVFNTVRAALPIMIKRQYGRIIAIGSTSSLMGFAGTSHYAASKHGVAGFIKSLAREVGDKNITANYVVANGVATSMIQNEAMYSIMNPDDPTLDGVRGAYMAMNAIPKPWIEPEDVARLVLFYASDAGKYTTGSAIKIDLGATP